MRILILTNQLLTTCGVSKHLLYFLKEAKKNPDFEFTLICGGGDAINDYRNLVKEIFVWPWILHNNRSFRCFSKSFYKLLALQKKEKFDIFHSHNHYAANIAKIVSVISKIKTVQTVHGLIEPIGRLNHYPSEYFITVNEQVYDYLIKQRRKSIEKIRLIRSGVPIQALTTKGTNKKLKIISAGRLIPEKGFDVFIKAIRKLKVSDLERAEFLIAGCGEYEMELKKLSNELNVQINFIGEVKDFNACLSSTDIFVLASQSEGFPLTIIEAALNKNLIISSNFLGYDSILQNNINCLIFNIDDAQELAEKISYAIQNFKDLHSMINKMYELAVKEFDLNKMVDKTLNFYSEILN
ncbi:MAG: hypothetical protein B6D44_14845 [Ignavibacteriales bacterium UTCHB2]|nr:MAG: GalNAc-alpha-(1->4)-GalNAc-alpha-(1->3)-diNAcBac-PP-undecaprenol alpha-1,4-N-acetyl-D-galactosaminyltransferase [Ignavibacteria bacterium ADurb.Bin266]OQY70729.1 MAG: hypothetical protein B6D44_14845 [Ignavibacteriales bacterium UTCHB2]HQI41240.1 glycosyltransferase family 4 protein [Ignavibacteriaceae bacterium]